MTDHGGDLFRELPSSWETLRVKQLFRIRKDIAGTLGYTVWSVTQHGLLEKDITSGEGQLSMDYSKYQMVRVGDMVMNHMDLITGGVDIGVREGVTSPDYRVFIPRSPGKISKRYYVYLFRVCYWTKKFYSMGQGSAHLGRWRLPRLAFEGLVVPAPPLKEQKQIAAFLDYETAKIDALIEKQQQLIALLREKRQAVISQAVTKGLNPDAPMRDSGDSWLGRIPAHWSQRPVKHLARVDNSGAYGVEPDLLDQTLPVATTAQIAPDGTFRTNHMPRRSFTTQEVAQYECSPNDILVVKSSGSAASIISGKAGIVTPTTSRFVFSNFLMRLVPDSQRVEATFLYAFLTSSITRERVHRMVSTTTYPNLQVGEYTSSLAPLPPLDEQVDIAHFLDAKTARIDMIINRVQLAVDALQERRTALISAAVTGKIDVRDWKPPTATSEPESELEAV